MSQAPNLLQENGFSTEQKEYLSGFAAGASAFAAMNMPTFAGTLAANGQPTAAPVVVGPDALQLEAQAAQEKAGKKLVPEEKAKREKHPFDRWDQMVETAQKDQYPKGTDVLMWKYHGLFYVAPAQDSFMCRLRFYGGLMDSIQMRSLAKIADRFGGGYVDCTTRANLQIREIKAGDAIHFLESLQEGGFVARGSGADNIRNVTGSATAGIDPHELYDTRELARQMHHYILNHREMYGLPRKFNIAFDGGGAISSLEDTNDIGFSAVRVPEGKAVAAGVYFRVAFGGITGHKDFAIDEGLLLTPEQCIPFAAATVRVFIKHGDRTDRKKARLKYVLDAWGHEKFVAEVEKEWGERAIRLPLSDCESRPTIDRTGHIGWHSQKQEGFSYVGVVCPVGRITTNQMRGLARISDDFGSGDLRLTVWQNILLIDIPDEKRPAVERAIRELGLDFQASGVRAGLIACTGNAGCKYANANTKKNALEVADYLEGTVELDQSVNIHLTGCPNSCAQHYIGDIGYLGTKVEQGDDMVEGYHLFVGGGYGEERGIGREVKRSIAATEVPVVTEKLLKNYLASRANVLESFLDWTKRYSTEELTAFCE
ncbi:sulfite reductase [ferredoxin] [Abditibacteriota bacterium]|nr:sulfite reductase [ferredoxin] [Abditibacteriota bacterium]